MARKKPGKRIKEAKGQGMLPFGQKRAKNRQKEAKAKGPTRLQKRETVEAAERLCRQAYAILSSQPQLFGHRDIAQHKREVWHYVELFRKGRLTYAKAQAAVGAATSVLDEAGVRYRL